MSNTIMSTIASLLSLITPPQSGDTVRVTVNTHNNVGHTAQQTTQPPSLESPTKTDPFSKKPLFIGLAALGGFTALKLYLRHLTSHLNNYSNWSLWRQDISIEKLNTADDILEKTLKESIEVFYNQNLSSSLKLFLQDIEHEKNIIKQFQIVTDLVNKTPLTYILSSNERIIKQLPSRIARLDALKKILSEEEKSIPSNTI